VKPYYDEDGITIYQGDCRAFLPSIGPADVSLVLTDPPYGIAWKPPSSGGVTTVARKYKYKLDGSFLSDGVKGDLSPFDINSLSQFSRLIVFGANYFDHPPGGLIVWDKTGGGKARSFLPGAEAAWTNVVGGVHIYHHMWMGAYRDHGDPEWRLRLHPTQKPTRLMRWILEKWTEPGDLILDPYMGSGPVAQACHEMGRRYIGIEIEERYCEIAVQRLAQGVLAL
jgi:DNA modification methylase